MPHQSLPAEPVPTQPGAVAVSSESSRSSPTPGYPSPGPSSQKFENRSDSGQFWSDSPPFPQPSTLNSQPACSACDPVHQPSTLNSQPLWSLQPNEPAADYQLFAAWLQLPAPRRFPHAAQTLGCSLHRLRRLSACHHWKTRAAAFDRHRAHTAQTALEQVVRDQTANWKERVEHFRVQEWLLYEDMLQAARQALQEFRKHPARASFRDLLALYELAFDLGRRACGMPLEPAAPAATQPKPPWGYLDVQAALNKIYGQPLPGESDEVAPPGSPPPPTGTRPEPPPTN